METNNNMVAAATFAQNLKSSLASAIKTTDEALTLFVAATLAGATTVLYGNRGSGKSSLVEALCRALGMDEIESNYRVNGSMGMTTGQVTAEYDISKLAAGKKVVEVAKFVEAAENVALFDEVDKANPYVMHDLLTLLAEGIVKLGTYTRKVQLGAFYLTMNPVGVGTFSHDLPEPLKDRIDWRLIVPEPEGEDMADALGSKHSRGDIKSTRSPVPVVGTPEDLKLHRKAIWDGITLSDEAVKTAAYLVRSTQICPEIGKAKAYLAPGAFPALCQECKARKDGGGRMACYASQGLSMRTADSALLLARGIAAVEGRVEVTGKDVLRVFPYVVAHRANFTEQPKNGDQEKHVQQFVAQLHTAASDAINISCNPEKFTTADIERIKKQGSPLVLEALKKAESVIAASSEKVKKNLGRMSAGQLQREKKRLSEADAAIVEEMLQQRKLVKIEGADNDWINDPFAVEALMSPEGNPFFDDEEWTNVVEGQTVTGAISSVTGTLVKSALLLKFEDAVQADTFRQKLQAEFADTFVVAPAYGEELEAKLIAGGYLDKATAPKASLKPEVNAMAQESLF